MIQIITKNNAATIQKAIESALPCEHRIVVIDLGSTDETIEICEKLGVFIMRFPGEKRDVARNLALANCELGEPCFWLEPWEVIAQGHKQLRNPGGPYYVKIINNQQLTKEIRGWTHNHESFSNPVFERLNLESKIEKNVLLYSTGREDHEDLLKEIDAWKEAKPTLSQPYYYQACVLLALQRYDDFLRVAEHFLHIDKETSMSTMMTRYYFAMVQCVQKKKVRPALQNLSLCLAAKPLMAEFWCLMGDVYYHLLHKFPEARNFYENAMILGSKRLNSDKWPMDISKYKEYPTRMIRSCDEFIKNTYGLGALSAK